MCKRKKIERRAKYSDVLLRQVSRILFQHDPLGVDFESNTDEYDGEAELILMRLRANPSAPDVRTIVYQVFVELAGEKTAGAIGLYLNVARDVRMLWHDHVLGFSVDGAEPRRLPPGEGA